MWHRWRISRSKMKLQAPSTKLQRSTKIQIGTCSLKFLWCLVLGICSFGSSLASGRAASMTDVACYPPTVQLSSAKSSQRIVVQASYENSVTRDVTDHTRYRVLDPKIARIDDGKVVPLADGTTELRVSFQARTLIVPITVTNAALQPGVSFKLDVMPVFMKAGCNAGACHGCSRGKDGFRLSLFGFD